ncbi:T9SS type A sorting domain-containing protein [Mariniflexile sp. AS56]|uniref:T9SS type A sorting domain-containing protein n=1 Tax=Mariniflexile sp. AS56 TaxID=3063957 RepID=UPI0026F03CA8|nr:T9SS type A sorting domain-containing protein [Mariniflexile sp. AS56]MDO7171010.1 T9SS type A sorting domain-containing protein [Mariniflexile sp. AS56]
MKRVMLQTGFSLLVFLVSVSGLNAQILLKEASLKKQIDNSSLVVEGQVVSKKSFRDAGNKNIYTVNTVRVYKVFKGEFVETIEVVTRGGTVGLSAEVVTPSLTLDVNDVGVYMLYDNNVKLNTQSKTSKKQFKPYGSLQGFYKYNVYTDQAINPFNKKSGIETRFYDEIMSHTKTGYVNVSSFEGMSKQSSVSKSVLAPGNITFTPTSGTGGTKTVLTINGTGFGGSKGKVLFSNADDGGATFIEALGTQVLTWTDTKITVEIPSRAGTGKIRVVDSASGSAPSASNLTVTATETNIEYDADDAAGPLPAYAYKLQHVNENAAGGYTWQMFTDFNANANAKAAFLRAFESWRCATGINWVIGATTTVDIDADDGVNVIRFDNGSELETDVLGQCISYFNGCSSGSTFSWFVAELDIVFDDAANWNYSPAVNSTGITQYDFESVALHELGHGHQLSHVNDTNDVLHYAISNSEEQRALGSRNINAANVIQARSTSSMSCGQLSMTNHPCYLSVEEEELNASISMYPNPTNGLFYIKNTSLVNLDKIVVYDVSGRLISEQDATSGSRTKTINLRGVSKGLYFVKIISERAEITKKILID